jgi:oligo-1,6-glucosidase
VFDVQEMWWKEAVVYQVYWRSFFDTNGDGYGDLRGVIEKLDYIKELGVDVIWLNPFYVSPDKDNGYDIQDYYAIMPKAGTMADFEELLQEACKRDLKVIMDLVVNHTSDEHPWFIESRSGKDSPKRDWYIWKDGREGQPPNNWRSYFCPSTWTLDKTTGQYYFHSFAVEQPDLNWGNPEVREEIYRMMRFWLDKGIAGFRMDVINLLAKQKGFPDSENPDNISYLGNNPGIHEYLQEMHEKVLTYYDVFTVGEIPFVTPEDGTLYVGENRNELNTLFHFEVCDDMPTWDLKHFKSIQKRWYEGLWGNGWNSQFLNNHDHTRQVTRYGNDKEYRIESAKLLATMIHTLPGMPYIYQGEEIGMTGVRFHSIDEYNDIAMKNKYHELVLNGIDPQVAMEQLQPLSRDNSRTPVQWNNQEHAGFTAGEPWIKVNPNYSQINVEAALSDTHSVYYHYKKLIELRKKYKAMVYGTFQTILEDIEDLYAYYRHYKDETLFIISHFSENEQTICLPGLQDAELLLSNYPVNTDSDKICLKPYEARLYLIAK